MFFDNNQDNSCLIQKAPVEDINNEQSPMVSDSEDKPVNVSRSRSNPSSLADGDSSTGVSSRPQVGSNLSSGSQTDRLSEPSTKKRNSSIDSSNDECVCQPCETGNPPCYQGGTSANCPCPCTTGDETQKNKCKEKHLKKCQQCQEAASNPGEKTDTACVKSTDNTETEMASFMFAEDVPQYMKKIDVKVYEETKSQSDDSKSKSCVTEQNKSPKKKDKVFVTGQQKSNRYKGRKPK